MPQLLCKIEDKIAKPLNDLMVCNNSDFTIKFYFDEQWEELPVKTARFIWGKGLYQDIVFEGDVCKVPVISNTKHMAVGVFAGNISTSTPAIFNCRKTILDGIGVPAPPSEDVYNQIIELLEHGGGGQGPKGDKGDPGPKGDDGFSPRIDVVVDTEDAYVLEIQDATHTFETPNLKGSGGGGGDIPELRAKPTTLYPTGFVALDQNMMALTKEEFDAMPKDPNTYYFVTDDSIYMATIDDRKTALDSTWSSQKIKDYIDAQIAAALGQ